jgi:hypothetical protein
MKTTNFSGVLTVKLAVYPYKSAFCPSALWFILICWGYFRPIPFDESWADHVGGPESEEEDKIEDEQ